MEQELLTLQTEHTSSPPVFSGDRATRSLVLCVMICKSLFVLLSFFFWQLCCLFFDLCIMITPLVSSSPSYMSLHWNTFSWLQANHCMSSRVAANADFITHNLTQPGTESTIYLTRDNHINYNTITRQSLLYIIYVSDNKQNMIIHNSYFLFVLQSWCLKQTLHVNSILLFFICLQHLVLQ